MRSNANEIWNRFISENYKQLVAVARKIHRDAEDLVHTAYLACREKENVRNMMGYFTQVMKRQVYSGKFGLDHTYNTYEFFSTATDDEQSDVLMLEQMELFVDRLHKFDRAVWKLHVQGYSMVEVSAGAGIPLQTLYNSLSQTRKTITECFSRQAKSGITE